MPGAAGSGSLPGSGRNGAGRGQGGGGALSQASEPFLSLPSGSFRPRFNLRGGDPPLAPPLPGRRVRGARGGRSPFAPSRSRSPPLPEGSSPAEPGAGPGGCCWRRFATSCPCPCPCRCFLPSAILGAALGSGASGAHRQLFALLIKNRGKKKKTRSASKVIRA